MSQPTNHVFTVFWSDDDEAFVATTAEYPSLSWVAETADAALAGLRDLVDSVVADLSSPD